MDQEMNNNLVQLHTDFVINAFMEGMTLRQLKMTLFVTSFLNPLSNENPPSVWVSIADMKHMLTKGGSKQGSIYKDIKELVKKIKVLSLTFPSGFEIEGVQFDDYINWYNKIKVELRGEEVGYRFYYTEDMVPFIMDLPSYVAVSFKEIMPMSRVSSIRFILAIQGYRDRMRQHEKVSKLVYDVETLKKVLGVGGKYSRFQNFHDKQILPGVEEVNKCSSKIHISKIEIVKEKGTRGRGGTVTGVVFHIKDHPKRKNTIGKSEEDVLLEVEKDLLELTRAKRRAFDILVEFGVTEPIAIYQMIPSIVGGEIEGFEDHFVRLALEHFNKKSKNKNPGAFVKWWIDKNAFGVEKGEEWSKINELIVKIRKEMEAKDIEAYSNRLIAKNMTNTAFEKMVEEKEVVEE